MSPVYVACNLLLQRLAVFVLFVNLNISQTESRQLIAILFWLYNVMSKTNFLSRWTEIFSLFPVRYSVLPGPGLSAAFLVEALQLPCLAQWPDGEAKVLPGTLLAWFGAGNFALICGAPALPRSHWQMFGACSRLGPGSAVWPHLFGSLSAGDKPSQPEAAASG